MFLCCCDGLSGYEHDQMFFSPSLSLSLPHAYILSSALNLTFLYFFTSRAIIICIKNICLLLRKMEQWEFTGWLYQFLSLPCFPLVSIKFVQHSSLCNAELSLFCHFFKLIINGNWKSNFTSHSERSLFARFWLMIWMKGVKRRVAPAQFKPSVNGSDK